MQATIEALDDGARRLRPFYSHFLDPLGSQVLLTAHSHQAWPNASLDGQIAAWRDAAQLIDRKWDRVLGEVLPEFQAHVARRIGSSRPGDLALAPNTHELVTRLASCFSADAAVVTTDAEFHSLRRQLRRLAEDGLRLTEVPVGDGEGLLERFLAAVEEHRPSWVALSQVFFTTGRVVTELPVLLETLATRGIPALVDVYHGFNVLELEVDRWPGTVFVTGGGYKYAQTGEGAAWMLLPPDARAFRPRYTGWFSDFRGLEHLDRGIDYGPGGQRFSGATFDPSGLYRGVHVMRWMDAMDLTPAELRRASLERTALILQLVDEHQLERRGLRLATPRAPERRGGFVALETDRAGELSMRLAEAGVHTDFRGRLLRLGPAPYTGGSEITRAMQTLARLL